MAASADTGLAGMVVIYHRDVTVYGSGGTSRYSRCRMSSAIQAHDSPSRTVSVVMGGAGFLGSHLCERLLDGGSFVLCVDNFITGSLGNVAHLEDRPGFSILKHNVTEHIEIDGPVDYIFNFASPASPVDYLEYPIQTLKVGSLGTHNGLGLAKEKGAIFVLASTSEVYGDPQVNPQPESYWGHVNPIGPRGVYDEAKRFAEAITLAYHRQHGIPVRIARIFNTYGPRMRPNDGRAIPAFFTAALRNEPLPVHGDGSQTRSLCYVDDLIEGIVRLANSDYSQPVNIGNPHEVTILELAELVQDVVGNHPGVEFLPRPVDDPTVRCPDISRAREVLGWEPQIDLREGLESTRSWFESCLPAR